MPSVAPSRLLVAAGLSSLALLAGCGSSDSSSTSTPAASASTSTPAAASGAAKSGPVAIAYRDFAIEPAKITVKAGSKLTWTNYDSTQHNVIVKDGAPAAFKSRDFNKGQTVTWTPTKPGVYPYLCTFHAASMQGVITVVK